MDRLKFRSYDKQTGLMTYYNFQVNNKPLKVITVPCADGIMQCTAVKDKNGELIFEGDIVKIGDYNPLGWTRERIGVVQYKYGDYYPAFYIVTTFGDAKDFNNDMEVIGNKYQHPELLEVDSDEEA